jgi:uncharacterized membrane protein
MEEIGDVIGKGFAVWRNNLNLCIPFLLSSVLSLLIMIPFSAALLVAIVPQIGLNSTSVQQMQDQFLKNEEALSNIPLELVVKVALLFILMAILITMVNAFFTAGAIGMAGQALEKGKPDNGIMWSAGKKHFWNMFQASVLMGFIMVTGLVFVLPAVALQPKSLQLEPQAMGLLLMGTLLLILYVLAFSMVLATAPYALVVKNLGPMQAILASIDFFRYNKFDVLVLWLVVVAISISIQMIFGLFSSENGIGNQTLTVVTGLVNILVLAPLTNLWWTRLYMDRKGILKVDEVKDIW